MKKRITFYSILFGMPLLLALHACQKDPRKSIPLNQLTLDYFQFKNGSEWIYELVSDTNIQERVVATDFSTGKNRFDEVEINFFKYTLVSDLNYSIMVRAESGMKDPVDQIAFVTKDSFLSYGPILWSDASGVSVGSNDSFRYDESVRIGGVEYNKVIRIGFANHPVYKNISMSKELGIVQKHYRNGKIFRLRSYNIIR
jgi:hypothetical protein